MEKILSQLKKYYQYTRERFPVPAVMIYSAALYYLSYSFPVFLGSTQTFNAGESLLGFFVIFFSLFHLRIFDEHKDYEKDRLAHPDRMLSRGVITLSDLRSLLVIIIILEFAISLYLGLMQTIIWGMIFVYSLLMFKEFFVPEFLNKRIGLYLVSHQLLVPIILAFGFSQRYDVTGINSLHLMPIALFLFGAMMITMNLEIARKTWSKDREHEHADSYTKIWGIANTVIINQLIALAAAGTFIYLYFTQGANLIYTIVAGLLYLLFLVVELLFVIRPDNKNSKLVEGVGALYSIALLVNSIVLFFLF